MKWTLLVLVFSTLRIFSETKCKWFKRILVCWESSLYWKNLEDHRRSAPGHHLCYTTPDMHILEVTKSTIRLVLTPLDNPCLSTNIGLGILEGRHLRPTRRIYTLALPRSQRRPKSTNIWKQLQYADVATNMISRQHISTQRRLLISILYTVLDGFVHIYTVIYICMLFSCIIPGGGLAWQNAQHMSGSGMWSKFLPHPEYST